jgi:ribosomal protein S16
MPFYRVIIESSGPRIERLVEAVGTYDPPDFEFGLSSDSSFSGPKILSQRVGSRLSFVPRPAVSQP